MARIVRLLVVLALAISASAAPARAQQEAMASKTEAFAQELDLTPLSRVAVHFEGRLTSFDSFAYKLMKRVIGPGGHEGRSHAFTLLDMLFRPEAYERADVIYVRKKPMRAQVAQAIADRPDVTPERLERFMDTGRISPDLLANDPQIAALMQRLRSDTVKTARFVEELEAAMSLREPRAIANLLKVVPPASAEPGEAPWHSVAALFVHGPDGASAIPGMDPALERRLREAWSEAADAWISHTGEGRDPAAEAERASAALASFAEAAHEAAPDRYPADARLAWESWYFRWGNMTWVWMVYLVSAVPLLLSVIYRWRGARWAGLSVFAVAVGLHTFAVMLRWYVSGHWPNSNMFEAVTTSAWMGAVGALGLELIARKSPMRDLFALAGAASAMVALMCAHFMPVSLSPEISNRMPILHDVWLYIHTNVIIFSYVLIAMAAVTALLHLGYRLIGGPKDYARGGGAGTLVGMGAASAALAPRKTNASMVLDGVTMVLMELAFVLLWAGIVMGAIWADHSWGRPWGWDPKEVFALNTFLIFVLLVHVRLKVADKGLWTALLAVAGCGVMIFNWIVINFIISGLHSYA